MIDCEVERLRRLRAVALRTRAVARALAKTKAGADDALLQRGRGVAWRVARNVTGRLRAHPYAPFQRGASLGLILRNGAIAKALALSSTNRTMALQSFDVQLRALARELDDTRAFTWAADLSDSLGRSQAEVRLLRNALHGGPVIQRGGKPVMAGGKPAVADAVARGADYPFLAF